MKKKKDDDGGLRERERERERERRRKKPVLGVLPQIVDRLWLLAKERERERERPAVYIQSQNNNKPRRSGMTVNGKTTQSCQKSNDEKR